MTLNNALTNVSSRFGTLESAGSAGSAGSSSNPYHSLRSQEMERQAMDRLQAQVYPQFQALDPIGAGFADGINSITVSSSPITAMLKKVIPKKKPKKTELTQDLIEKTFQDFAKQIKKNKTEELKMIYSEIVLKVQQIDNIKKDIVSKEEKIKESKPFSLKKKFESLSKDFEEIKNNPKISGIYSYGKDLLIETKELYVSNFLMKKDDPVKKKIKKPRLIGKFSIRLSIQKDVVLLAVENMDFISDNQDSPTILNGACCWGNVSSDVKNDLSSLNIKEFVEDMLAYVEAPSNKNAYVSWGRYFENQKKRKSFSPREPEQSIHFSNSSMAQQSSNWVFISDGITAIDEYPTIQAFTGSTGYTPPRQNRRSLEESLLSDLRGNYSRIVSGRADRFIEEELTLSGKIFIYEFIGELNQEGSVPYHILAIDINPHQDKVELRIIIRHEDHRTMTPVFWSDGSETAANSPYVVRDIPFNLDIPENMMSRNRNTHSMRGLQQYISSGGTGRITGFPS
jgi:hypothetical protein